MAFDKTAYQRDYMREYRRAGKARPIRPGVIKKRSPAHVPATATPQMPRMSFEDVRELVERSAAMARHQPRTEGNSPFRLPVFPKSAVPPSGGMAMDNAIATSNNWATTNWIGGNSIFDQYAGEGLVFLGYPYLAELAQRPEYRVISETWATEMTRKWIKFSGTGDDDKTDKIKELVDFLDHLKARDIFAAIAANDGFFGRAHLFMELVAGDGSGRSENVGLSGESKELASDVGNGRNEVTEGKQFGKGCLKRLQVIEPVWVYPQVYNATDPLQPNWYSPQQWYVMGREIHRSRLLPFVGRPVPDLLKPAYAFGGLPLSQMAKPYVDIWLNTRQSVADIVKAFSVMILQTNMAQMMLPGAATSLLTRLMAFSALRDNNGVFAVDRATEDVKNVSAPLGTLDVLQAQAQEHCASVVRIPLIKYTGLQPKGLNASSEGEIRVWYDGVNAFQHYLFGQHLTTVIDFAMISLWGQRDPEITHEFEPLWELSEKEKSEKRKIDAETGQIHIDAGVISPEEERTRIANDPTSEYHGLDPEDIPDLADEEAGGLMPGGKTPPDAGGGGDDGEEGTPQ